VKKGKEAKCIGSGMVIIIDGKHIQHTNMPFAENNEPVCIEGLRVDILCEENGYLLEERKFIPAKKVVREEHLKD
jgi:cyanophycinase